MAISGIIEGTRDEVQNQLQQFSKEQRFRLVPLVIDVQHPANEPENPAREQRDPELVARVKSVRGKYAHTAASLGTEELHEERQRDKAKEEARIQGYRP